MGTGAYRTASQTGVCRSADDICTARPFYSNLPKTQIDLTWSMSAFACSRQLRVVNRSRHICELAILHLVLLGSGQWRRVWEGKLAQPNSPSAMTLFLPCSERHSRVIRAADLLAKFNESRNFQRRKPSRRTDGEQGEGLVGPIGE